MLSKMATNLNTIFLSIVMFHLVLSAQTQMHPIHLESPAPQPHPPQSQPQTPHHNSSQYGTTEGSLQPQGTYGNKQVCPCYNNWKTQLGGPKCP
ncbi:hypothetical protein IGI04_003891 [Brassica rapa subsp. trilocularis]|nr:hypothetical protein IGI04_003891 [Brassica rapa subsp. trilocularis]